MHYGVLVMETKLVKLGKVAKYIKNRVDIDCRVKSKMLV